MTTALVFAAVTGVLYLLHCRVYPRTACWWCRGDAKRRDGSGRNWFRCLVCKGSGSRLRLGALAWSRYRAERWGQ